MSLSAIECYVLDFAAKKHAGQLDKNGRCYMAHLFRVAMSVRDLGDPYYFMTAILHDVVEDTATTLQEISQNFGEEIADAVDSVTRRNLNGQKEDYAEFVQRAADHTIGRVVKLADVQDNLRQERMGRLPKETQSRLEKKYALALEILGAGAETERK